MSSLLRRYRDKWREAPRGDDSDGRVFSTSLLDLEDEALLATWEQMAARRYTGSISWMGPVYFDTFHERRALELGSGLGFDGLRFAQNGAYWTFADIVPDNLKVICRVAHLKGLADRVTFHQIGDDLSFSDLRRDYDAIWAFGSVHHVPFQVAREECLNALQHLKPGGRWMELIYPRERWLREGSQPFEQWGRSTDGDRTPWAEWYDVEKVRRRLFPAPFRTLLNFEFSSNSYRWLDLQYTHASPFRLEDFDLKSLSRSVDLMGAKITLNTGSTRKAWSFSCPKAVFNECAKVDLRGAVQTLEGAPGLAVDCELKVTAGVIGVGLVEGSGAYLPGAEKQ